MFLSIYAKWRRILRLEGGVSKKLNQNERFKEVVEIAKSRVKKN